jgi:hypothetical protein
MKKSISSEEEFDISTWKRSSVGEVVEHPRRRNRHEQTERGGHQGLGDTARNRRDTSRAAHRHAAEGVDDADHGAEQAGEGSGGGDGRQAAGALLEVGVANQRLALDGAARRLDDFLTGQAARFRVHQLEFDQAGTRDAGQVAVLVLARRLDGVRTRS